jgi:hypothetical protein
MGWLPAIGRHVTYYTASGKPRPATITAVAGNVLGLRVRRTGETYASVGRRSGARNGVWSRGGKK